MILVIDGDLIMVLGSPMRDYKSNSMGMEKIHQTLQQYEFLGKLSYLVAKIEQGREVRVRRKVGVRLREQQSHFQQRFSIAVVGRPNYYYREADQLVRVAKNPSSKCQKVVVSVVGGLEITWKAERVTSRARGRQDGSSIARQQEMRIIQAKQCAFLASVSCQEEVQAGPKWPSLVVEGMNFLQIILVVYLVEDCQFGIQICTWNFCCYIII